MMRDDEDEIDEAVWRLMRGWPDVRVVDLMAELDLSDVEVIAAITRLRARKRESAGGDDFACME